MKFVNKKKYQKIWHHLDISPAYSEKLVFGYPTRVLYISNFAGPKLWCQRLDSKGRFTYNLSQWYFEYEEDKLAFILHWFKS